MTPSEWERVERIAQRGAAPFRGHRLHADLLQEARCAAWLHSDDSDALAVHAAKCRVIDAARREIGRTGDEHAARRTGLATVELDPARTRGVEDRRDVAVEFGLSGQDARLARMLAAGFRQTEIAAEFGVTKSRVCQLVRGLRASLSGG